MPAVPVSFRKSVSDLLLASALGLFLELVFIRWLGSEIRIFAFYKNFALIGAFLGLGLGFGAARRSALDQRLRQIFLPVLAVNTVLILALGRTPISDFVLANPANTQEFIWAGSAVGVTGLQWLMLRLVFYAILWAMFILVTVMFLPLGLITAQAFRPFPPLRGYILNILGSLAGIAIYTFMSFMGWPPPVWFALAGAGAVYFLWPTGGLRRQALAVGIAALPAVLTWIVPTGAARTLWSPYYRIDIDPITAEGAPDLQLGYLLSVNQAWHQMLWDLEPKFVLQHYAQAPGHFDEVRAEYDAPYTAADRLDEVLVVGAGTGNDVAGALRAGAGHVTAVEIDPVILELGTQLHPEHPYADPARVTLVNQDARAFFRQDRQQYDLIVFGLLDSHTLFSTASSVRLDNFVYTRESLMDVRTHLKPDGLLALSFGVPAENGWIGDRIARTIAAAFGHPPRVFAFPSGNILYLIGLDPLPEPRLDEPLAVARPDTTALAPADITTDDWPYLYLRDRAIPGSYLVGLAGVIVLGLILTARTLPAARQVDPHYFFLGSAFFLLETKSVTELALLLGSTWVVNAAVIAAILVMIVVANLIVDRWKLRNPWPAYGLLGITLLINVTFPISGLLGLSLVPRVVLASLAQALPLFCAGLVFAISFSQANSIEFSFGFEILSAPC